jgi:hypothetical protein
MTIAAALGMIGATINSSVLVLPVLPPLLALPIIIIVIVVVSLL